MTTQPIIRQLEEMNPVELEEIRGHIWTLTASDTGCWLTLDGSIYRYFKKVDAALDYAGSFGIMISRTV